MVPAIVMAVLVSILLSNASPNIATFQEVAGLKIITQNAQIPGIGFFNNANGKHESIAGVQVSWLKSEELELTWPPITGAQEYNLKLQKFRV